MNTTRDYTISSVKRALDILKLFDESHRELTLSDLSQLSGIGKSSVGLEMYRIGLSKFNSLDVTKFARRHLQKLADEMGMICYIGIRQGDMLAMVGQILPPTVPVWTQLTVLGGGVSQLYSTGIGRLFLSQDSDDEICRYLDRIQPKKYTDATITDRAELLELIHQAGKQKYSGNFGENESHVYSHAGGHFRLRPRLLSFPHPGNRPGHFQGAGLLRKLRPGEPPHGSRDIPYLISITQKQN